MLNLSSVSLMKVWVFGIEQENMTLECMPYCRQDFKAFNTPNKQALTCGTRTLLDLY